MKKWLLLLLLSVPAWPTTYFACATANVNAANEWGTGTTGSCTCSGAGSPTFATGDTLNANGCTVTLNVDPGSVSVQPILTNDTTQGGSFAYATATNITVHADITANKAGTTILNITGSTGGGTLSGTLTGASGTGTGVTDTHTAVAFNVSGNITAGSGTGNVYTFSGSSGSVALTGNATAATGEAFKCTGNGTCTIAGNCIGSGTATGVSGCDGASATGTVTVTGNVINGLKSTGTSGNIRYTPAATNYFCAPKDGTYAVGTEDCTHTGGGGGVSTHAVELPLDPGVTNVKSGVNYGSLTGTLATSGTTTVCTNGWN